MAFAVSKDNKDSDNGAAYEHKNKSAHTLNDSKSVNSGQFSVPSSFGTYQLYDPIARLSVASFKVPGNWLAAGKVNWELMLDSVVDFSATFLDSNSGVVMSLSSGRCTTIKGNWKTARFYKNPKGVCQVFTGDLKRLEASNDIKLVSFSLNELEDSRAQALLGTSANNDGSVPQRSPELDEYKNELRA
ncbi:MAG: hypothetical protein ACI38Q_08195 [Candidatus Bruticola sp.]